MRFLALNVLTKNESLIIRVGRTVFSTDNKIRLFVRALSGVGLGTFAAIVGSVPYVVPLAIAFFYISQDYGRPCDNYFKKTTKTRNCSIFNIDWSLNSNAPKLMFENHLNCFEH